MNNKFYLAIFFIAYILISSFGLGLLKSARGWTSFAFFIGLLLYGTGALMYLIILRLLPLSFVFPISAGALILCTSIIGFFILNEPISLSSLFGCAAIAIGIFIISMAT